MSYENAESYKIRTQDGLYFLTFTIVDWIDLFTRKTYRDLFLEKGLLGGAYVIMSNHVHLIWQCKNGRISDLIRDFKSYFTKQCIEMINHEPESRRDWLIYMFQFYANKTNSNKYYKIWTSNNHPEEIETEDFLKVKLNYIHENPVRAGLVINAEEYLYSSASNYSTGKGIAEIDYLY